MSAPHLIYWDEWLAATVVQDAAVAALALTPSSIDFADYVDSGTEAFALTPSSTDIAQYVESATDYFFLEVPLSSFYDYFDDGVINPNYWVVVNPTITESGGKLNFTTTSAQIDTNPFSPTRGGFIFDSVAVKITDFQAGARWRLDLVGILFKDNGTIQVFEPAAKLDISGAASPYTISGQTTDEAGSTGPLGTATAALPVWLRLRRTYPGMVAEYSTDGSTWTTLASEAQDHKWMRRVHVSLKSISGAAGTIASISEYIFTGTQVETAQLVDAGTEVFALTPSSVDTAQYVEANTETYTLTPSATDTAQFSDSKTEALTLTPEIFTVVYTDDGFGTAAGGWPIYGETGSTHRALAQSFDVPSINAEIFSVELELTKVGSPSGNVIVDIMTDSGGSPSATSLATQTIPASSVPANPTYATFAFVFPIPPSVVAGSTYWIRVTRDVADTVNYVGWRQRTVLGVSAKERNLAGNTWLAISATQRYRVNYAIEADIAAFVDAVTEPLALTPSTTAEEHTTYDVKTELFSLVPNSTDIAQYIEQDTEAFALNPSAAEVAEFADSAVEVLSLLPASTDIGEFVDSATQSYNLIPSGSDIAQFVDAVTEIYALSPSAIEEHVTSDQDTEPFTLTPSADELHTTFDSDTELFLLMPSGADEYVSGGPGVAYSDSDTEPLILTPQGADIYGGSDAGVEEFSTIPSGSDIEYTTDTDTEALSLEATSTDVATTTDSGRESFLLIPTPVEVFVGSDALIVKLLLTAPGIEFKVLTDLVGRLYTRYLLTSDGKVYSFNTIRRYFTDLSSNYSARLFKWISL